jgi:transcription antitermination factor NusB
MPSRSRAREVALQSLYQIEANPGADDLERLQHRERFLQGRLRAAPLVDFARSLVEGVQAEQAALDAELDSRSQNWRVARMAATDRAVLRLAAFELLHTDVPGPVAVNEAIELAREQAEDDEASEVCVIGGLALFELALPKARRIYMTEVDAEPEGDVILPAFDEADWTEISREAHPAGPDDDHPFVFRVLERR